MSVAGSAESSGVPFIVDCDVHPVLPDGIASAFPYLPGEWRRRFEEVSSTQHSFGGLGGFRHPLPPLKVDATPPNGGLPGSDPEFTRVDLLDRLGVNRALLVPLLNINGWVNPDESTVIAGAYNRYFAERWLPVDDRYTLAMMVSALDPVAAAKEIREFGGTDGVVGAFMPVHNMLMGHRSYYPIYEALEEMDLPIVYHATAAEGTMPYAPAFAGGTPSSYAEFFTLIPQIAESQIVSMVWEGVFERFPKLKVVFLESGWAWVPHLMWRMDSAWRSFRTERPWVRKAPSEYIREHVRFATQPYPDAPKQEQIGQIMEMMDARNTLVFATDYPHWDGDEGRYIYDKLVRDTDEQMAERILSSTALDMFPRMRRPLPAELAATVGAGGAS